MENQLLLPKISEGLSGLDEYEREVAVKADKVIGEHDKEKLKKILDENGKRALVKTVKTTIKRYIESPQYYKGEGREIANAVIRKLRQEPNTTEQQSSSAEQQSNSRETRELEMRVREREQATREKVDVTLKRYEIIKAVLGDKDQKKKLAQTPDKELKKTIREQLQHMNISERALAGLVLTIAKKVQKFRQKNKIAIQKNRRRNFGISPGQLQAESSSETNTVETTESNERSEAELMKHAGKLLTNEAQQRILKTNENMVSVAIADIVRKYLEAKEMELNPKDRKALQKIIGSAVPLLKEGKLPQWRVEQILQNAEEKDRELDRLAKTISESLSRRSKSALLKATREKAEKALAKYLEDSEITLEDPNDIKALTSNVLNALKMDQVVEQLFNENWREDLSDKEIKMSEKLENEIKNERTGSMQIQKNAALIVKQIQQLANYPESEREALMQELLDRLESDLNENTSILEEDLATNPISLSGRIRSRIWLHTPTRGRKLATALVKELKAELGQTQADQTPTEPPPSGGESSENVEIPQSMFTTAELRVGVVETTFANARLQLQEANSIFKKTGEKLTSSQFKELRKLAHEITEDLQDLSLDTLEAQKALENLKKGLTIAGTQENEAPYQRYLNMKKRLDAVSIDSISMGYAKLKNRLNKLNPPSEAVTKQFSRTNLEQSGLSERNSAAEQATTADTATTKKQRFAVPPRKENLTPTPDHPKPSQSRFNLPEGYTPQAPISLIKKTEAQPPKNIGEVHGEPAPLPKIQPTIEPATSTNTKKGQTSPEKRAQVELINLILQAKHDYPDGSLVEYTSTPGNTNTYRVENAPTSEKPAFVLKKVDSNRKFFLDITPENLKRLRKLVETPTIERPESAEKTKERSQQGPTLNPFLDIDEIRAEWQQKNQKRAETTQTAQAVDNRDWISRRLDAFQVPKDFSTSISIRQQEKNRLKELKLDGIFKGAQELIEPALQAKSEYTSAVLKAYRKLLDINPEELTDDQRKQLRKEIDGDIQDAQQKLITLKEQNKAARNELGNLAKKLKQQGYEPGKMSEENTFIQGYYDQFEDTVNALDRSAMNLNASIDNQFDYLNADFLKILGTPITEQKNKANKKKKLRSKPPTVVDTDENDDTIRRAG